jgi:protoporphyrinogen/coproporphyrinogen III oxidase
MIYDAVIVGAGISGLTAAHHLNHSSRSILVLEAQPDVGGMIRTVRNEGYLMEAGPNTLPGYADALLKLAESVGLKPMAAASASKNRYIYHNCQLKPVPTSPLTFLKSSLLSPAAKGRLLLEPFQPPELPTEESVADFVRRRLGNEALQSLMAPFLSGVYAGDPEQLSLQAVFPRLAEWEQTSGSLLKAAMRAKKSKQPNQTRQSKAERHRLYSFEGGLAQLPEALANALPQECVRLGVRLESLKYEHDAFYLQLSDGAQIVSRTVLMATPAGVTASLVEPLHPAMARQLSQIPYVPLAVVHTGVKNDRIPRVLDGFGFLVSRPTTLSILGSIWASSLFPNRAPAGHSLFASFIGGALSPEILNQDDDSLIRQVQQDLQTVFQAPQMMPAFSAISRYPRAIPQYNLGHKQRIQHIEDMLGDCPGLFLVGNYLHGISLNDCVKQADTLAQSVLTYLNQPQGVRL